MTFYFCHGTPGGRHGEATARFVDTRKFGAAGFTLNTSVYRGGGRKLVDGTDSLGWRQTPHGPFGVTVAQVKKNSSMELTVI